MLRALKEFWRPALKCARIGHQMKISRFDGFARPARVGWHSSVLVAVRIHATAEVCRRCAFMDPAAVDLTPIEGTHSLSMPAARWDELDRLGFSLREVE